MKNNYSYFKNEECEYFPCHSMSGDVFNCLFCCCPLYALGDRCGGHFVYTQEGIKDCSGCTLPHGENGYAYVSSKLREVSELAKKNRHTEE